MNQKEFIAGYNRRHREPFNPELFKRDDQLIMDELKKVILSCQKNRFFTLEVKKFEEIDDYNRINRILYNIEQKRKEKNNKKKENPYEFINLKDSDIRLLAVTWHVKLNFTPKKEDEITEDTFVVYIAIPRVVDKYYFRISGNLYFASYQIVDGSIYNNGTSVNRKTETVVLKSLFMPIKIYRSTVELEEYLTGESIRTVIYRSKVFKKTLPVLRYTFAKLGLLNTLAFYGINDIKIYNEVESLNINSDEFYVFNKKDIYIVVPKYLFDNDHVVQSFVSTIYGAINNTTTYNEIFTNEFWMISLGNNYNSKFSLDKAISVLDSLESLYDIKLHETLRLPEEYKRDIYYVLRWLIREFSRLKLRSNLDMSTKRLRCEEYIPTLYAMKVSKGIYRISDKGRNITIAKIKQAIYTHPLVLLNAITKCSLVNYNNLVSDNDAINAIKFTFKGPSGLGESGYTGNSKTKKNSSVPEIYRYVNYSQYGIIDTCSSTATDPGLSGNICPRVKLYDGSFSDYQEPNEWENEYNDLLNNYKSLTNRKEIEVFKNTMGIDSDTTSLGVIQDSIDIYKQLMSPVAKANIAALEQMEADKVLFIDENGYFEVSLEQ